MQMLETQTHLHLKPRYVFFILFLYYTNFFSSRLRIRQLQPQPYEERTATTTTTSMTNDTKKKAQETCRQRVSWAQVCSFIFFTFLLLIFIIRLPTMSTSKATPSPQTATQMTTSPWSVPPSTTTSEHDDQRIRQQNGSSPLPRQKKGPNDASGHVIWAIGMFF